MIELTMPQRSADWFLARAAVPTASEFDRIITSAKLQPSKSVNKYIHTLLAEALIGGPLETDSSPYMERGVELEAEAAEWYAIQSIEPVRVSGFCLTDDMTAGCSPDLLVGEDGGCEIKIPAISTHVEYLLKGCMPTKYILQVQGSMYVTGRKWWDFLSWHPSLKPLVVRIMRDEKVCAALDVGIKALTEIMNKKALELAIITGEKVLIDKSAIIAAHRSVAVKTEKRE